MECNLTACNGLVDKHQDPPTVNEYAASDVALWAIALMRAGTDVFVRGLYQVARAYADSGVQDEMLLWHLSAVAQQLPVQ
eukprot:3879930-Rhodomonas_salina.1